MILKIDKILKQAQKVQAQMATLQEELAKTEHQGSSGGGMVTARVNGQGDLLAVKISKEVIDPSDPEMLEDLVVSAVNDALRKSRDFASEQMNRLTGGLGFGGF